MPYTAADYNPQSYVYSAEQYGCDLRCYSLFETWPAPVVENHQVLDETVRVDRFDPKMCVVLEQCTYNTLVSNPISCFIRRFENI